MIDANVYSTGRLAWEPNSDLHEITKTWIHKNFSDDPNTSLLLSKMLYLSREAVLKGLYIGEMAKNEVTALGLEPPPTFYIWDIVGAANSVLSFVYYNCKDNLDEAIKEGFESVDAVIKMQDLIADLDVNKMKNPPIFEKLSKSLEYEKDLFETLAWYRKFFLSYYYWLDTGNHFNDEDWRIAYKLFQEKEKNHVIKYQANLDFPAYNFYAVDIAMDYVEQNQNVVWLSRGILVIIFGFLFSGSFILRKIFPSFASVSRKVIGLGLIKPWRLQEEKKYSIFDVLFISVIPIVILLFSLLISTSFQSTYFVIFMLVSFSVFLISLTRYHSIKNENAIPFISAIFAPFVAILGIYITTAAIRGPLFFWYHFWTSPEFRIILLSIYIMLNFWLFYAICVTAKNIFKISYFSAIGNILLTFGNVTLFLGIVVRFIGLDETLTAVNNELALLPLSLSKVLGISTQLNLNPHFPLYLIGFGFLIIISGFLLRVFGKMYPKAV
jgi:hypothetical protein